MHLLFTLPNLHEIKEQRGKVVEKGGSLVDNSDSRFRKTEGRWGWVDEPVTEKPEQETPPFRGEVGIQTKDHAEVCLREGSPRSPTTGHGQVITRLEGRSRPSHRELLLFLQFNFFK